MFKRNSQSAHAILKSRWSARRVYIMARRNETEEERAARKAATKAAKSAKRAELQGCGDPGKGRKPCTLCSRPRDLLIRCQVDPTLTWHMACGKCWMEASGGEIDGAGDRPHYRYGGLWKNHHKAASGRSKVPSTSKPGMVAAATAAATDDGWRRVGRVGGGRRTWRDENALTRRDIAEADRDCSSDGSSNDSALKVEDEEEEKEKAVRGPTEVMKLVPSAAATGTDASCTATLAMLLSEATLCEAEDAAICS
ncbi:hypothetical protein Vafri_12105 [Volvox africanus]|uniref:Uncharacterized protein n=1 Tax=Volvox africanus TaxID=51714 RepID=A0A8J4BDU2_9CHLO|nr:hypothetical protein Vafri_12105 [Volvox africanus]